MIRGIIRGKTIAEMCAKSCSALAITLLLLAAASVSVAQTGPTGTILGTVTDSSGAVIPKAKVTITNSATNVSQETITSSAGTYSAPFLIPGTYKVTVSSPGFSTESVTGIRIAVGLQAAVDIQLKPGALNESVTVTANAVALDTTNASVGQVISDKQVVDLPLNGRNFTQLLLLESGAVQNSGEQGSYRANEGNALTIQGARPDSNQFMLDGITINDTYYQTPALVPSIDALQEFQEQTKGYSAAYGGGANQINLATKSGGNQFHGTLYDFLRNDKMDARSFFDTQINPLRQNQFGYTLGGPVWIPNFYNGKDKTFFFASYEGLRQRVSSTGFGNVPTTAELGGVFSSTVTDPETGSPFPNNTIPQDRFSTFAKTALSHFPAPNINLAQGNYRYTVRAPANADQQSYRIDQSIGSKNSLFVRYTQTHYKVAQPGGIDPQMTSYLDQPTHQVVGSWTRTFSPTVINQLRAGFMHEKVTLAGNNISESDWSAIGLKGLFPYNEYTTYPQINWMNTGLSAVGGPSYAPQYYYQPTAQISDTLSLVRGGHSISTGVDIHWMKGYVDTFSSPKFTFDGSFTGQQVGDMLLGLAQTANAQEPTQFATNPLNANSDDWYYTRIAPWVQDDWKVTPNLTVNLGLRYDFMPRPKDKRGNAFWLDPNIAGGGLYTASKEIMDAGLGGSLYEYGGNSPGSTPWKVFAPRVGIAYRPSFLSNTVLRGGFGIFFDSSEAKESFAGGEYPFAEQSVYYNVDISTLFPSVAAFGPVTSSALGFAWIENEYHPPYMEMWTTSVEHELPYGMKLEVSYLGSAGHHLVGRSWRSAPYHYDPAAPSSAASRKPYPNLGEILDHPFEFNSDYNALSVKVEHKGKTLTLLASYTWAHSLDNKSDDAGLNADASGNGPMDEYNWARDYSSSSFDLQHNFVGSFVYALPFGKGRSVFGNANNVADRFIGGWQVNGILSFRTGFPYSVTASDLDWLNHNYAPRADQVGDPSSGFTKSVDKWFNTNAFAQPALGAFGNTGRNILRGPGLANLDFSLFKNIPLGEHLNWQVRGEAFNLFNRANFGFPDYNANSASFGAITSANAGRIVQVAMKLIW